MGDARQPIGLSSETFHKAMAENALVACVLHRGPFADCAAEVSALSVEGESPWTWAAIDLSAAPDIARMFGLTSTEPHLLLMREQVVLYCEALSEATPDYLARAARLDMPQIRAALEAERTSQQSLFARRVCPTALRSR